MQNKKGTDVFILSLLGCFDNSQANGLKLDSTICHSFLKDQESLESHAIINQTFEGMEKTEVQLHEKDMWVILWNWCASLRVGLEKADASFTAEPVSIMLVVFGGNPYASDFFNWISQKIRKMLMVGGQEMEVLDLGLADTGFMIPKDMHWSRILEHIEQDIDIKKLGFDPDQEYRFLIYLYFIFKQCNFAVGLDKQDCQINEWAISEDTTDSVTGYLSWLSDEYLDSKNDRLKEAELLSILG